MKTRRGESVGSKDGKVLRVEMTGLMWRSGSTLNLSKVPGGINAMEYGGVAEGEVTFRKRVVEAVCKLLPPDVKYDVSHVQSMELLLEVDQSNSL